MSDTIITKERKTLLVIILTLITMFAEIIVGHLTHSMALFADGWHMGTHAFALSITFFTYVLIRKFSFNEEKITTQAGFISAILLGITGIFILFESTERFFNPLEIGVNEAIIVAIIGLIVNSVCILIMGEDGHHHCHHHNEHEHHHEEEHEDYNFKAAYLHILADALTSVFAIFALLCAKYFNWIFLDPIVGLAGGLVICIWAYGLIKSTGKIIFKKNL